MSGATFGWTIYGLCISDPFVISANVPSLMISIWLNSGATKLQYLEIICKTDRSVLELPVNPSKQTEKEHDKIQNQIKMVPQERILSRLLVSWTVLLVIAGWFQPQSTVIIGIFVNLNMVFFYGSPLQKIKQVVQEKNACTIHAPSTVLTLANTGFWTFYGISINKLVMIIPNACGLVLALIQGLLLLKYPSEFNGSKEEMQPLQDY